MWVIFRDPKTPFHHLDKYIVELVEDKDILTYRDMLHKVVGGRTFELNTDVWFNQQFVTSEHNVEYFARKYTCWDPEHCENRPAVETPVPGHVHGVVHVLGTVRHDAYSRR